MWSPVSKQPMHRRPNSFSTLESLHKQADSHSGRLYSVSLPLHVRLSHFSRLLRMPTRSASQLRYVHLFIDAYSHGRHLLQYSSKMNKQLHEVLHAKGYLAYMLPVCLTQCSNSLEVS